MTSARVLCVENQPEDLGILQSLLESAGYEVLSATTGAQALVMFQRHDLLGVLLEYDLPDLTGSAVRAEMKRTKPDIPILLFSGVGSQTPFLLRFFDAYLRNPERHDKAFLSLDN